MKKVVINTDNKNSYLDVIVIVIEVFNVCDEWRNRSFCLFFDQASMS